MKSRSTSHREPERFELRLTAARAVVLLFLPLVLWCSWPSTAAEDRLPVYSFKTPSRDGIGKVYMGREISFVMGHQGRQWLERSSREREERTDLVIEGMNLEESMVVADIGAGSGYFSFRMSPLVARVIAVDIQPEMLAVIERRRARERIDNVEPWQGTAMNPNLPIGLVDAALLVDAYHEFSHPREMVEGIFDGLKPGGLLYLVEYRGEDPEIPILPLHKMTVEQARRELEAVGFDFIENRRMLPSQHFMIFRRPSASAKGVEER